MNRSAIIAAAVIPALSPMIFYGNPRFVAAAPPAIAAPATPLPVATAPAAAGTSAPAAGTPVTAPGTSAATPPAAFTMPPALLTSNNANLRQEFSGHLSAYQASQAILATRLRTDAENAEQTGRFNRMQQILALAGDENQLAAMAFSQATAPAVPGVPAAPAGGAHTFANPAAAPGQAPGTIVLPGSPPGQAAVAAALGDEGLFAADPRSLTEDQGRRRFALHRNAVNHYLTTGDITPAQRFTITTATGGGVLMPTTIATPTTLRRQTNVLRAALQSYNVEPLRTTSSENLVFPIFDDTANVADEIAQNATGDNPKDPSVSGIPLGAKLYDSGTIWTANLALRAFGFDLLSVFQPMLRQRIEYKQSTAWMNTVKTTATVGVTAATQTGFTYANLVAWQHSIPFLYRQRCVFIVSDGFMQALRTMVDGSARPLFQPSLTEDAPDRLLGWPIFVSDQLATPAAGAVTGVALSVDMIKIRDVTGSDRVVRIIDEGNHPDQVGLRGYAYGDFGFQANGVRTFKQAP